MRLRALRKLEEMEIRRERDKLDKEREELAKLVESTARQRTRLKSDLSASCASAMARKPSSAGGGP